MRCASSGQNSMANTVTLVPDTKWTADPGPAYRVLLNEIEVGRVFREMQTFERGPRGARYVTSRWQSPRWFGNRHNLDRTTRWKAVADVLMDHYESLNQERDFLTCEALAREATVRRA